MTAPKSTCSFGARTSPTRHRPRHLSQHQRRKDDAEHSAVSGRFGLGLLLRTRLLSRPLRAGVRVHAAAYRFVRHAPRRAAFQGYREPDRHDCPVCNESVAQHNLVKHLIFESTITTR